MVIEIGRRGRANQLRTKRNHFLAYLWPKYDEDVDCTKCLCQTCRSRQSQERHFRQDLRNQPRANLLFAEKVTMGRLGSGDVISLGGSPLGLRPKGLTQLDHSFPVLTKGLSNRSRIRLNNCRRAGAKLFLQPPCQEKMVACNFQPPGVCEVSDRFVLHIFLLFPVRGRDCALLKDCFLSLKTQTVNDLTFGCIGRDFDGQSWQLHHCSISKE